METTPRPASLLASARAFVRKTAAIAILPLAVAAHAHAGQPTTVFEAASSGSSGAGYIDGFSGGTATLNSFLSANLPVYHGVIGSTLSTNISFTTYGVGPGTFTAFLGQSPVDGFPLAAGSTIPVSYDFTLTADNTLHSISWTLYFGIYDASTPGSVSGVGTGSFSGAMDLVSGASTIFYSPYLVISADGGIGGDNVTVDVTQLTYNATPVPETSTYALIAGAAVLGFVVVRRRRSAAQAA